MAQPSESLFQGGGLYLPSDVEDYHQPEYELACDTVRYSGLVRDTFMPADFSVPDALSAASESESERENER